MRIIGQLMTWIIAISLGHSWCTRAIIKYRWYHVSLISDEELAGNRDRELEKLLVQIDPEPRF